MFASLSDRLTSTFKNLRGKGRLSESDVDDAVRDIRLALLEADVSLPVVREFCKQIKVRALSDEVSQALNPAQQVVKIVHEELVTVLGGQARRLEFAKVPPTVIVLAGLQGAGKTTLAGKLAHYLKAQNHQPMLVAADLQRPNAVDQLKVMGERAGVPVYAPEPGNGVGDPVKVAKDSIDEAVHKLHDIVIVDTAGRLAIDAELMGQLRQVRDAVNAHEVLLVVDAMIGQDAVVTAETFATEIGIDGVVLTKLDGDARGGAALSIRQVTGAPVMFASTGEKLKDFELFHPDRMANRILDMGDMLTLIEQAETAFDEKQAEKMAKKVAKGEDFTLAEFLEQMQAVKKMGSFSKLVGMLPGMGEMRDQLDNFDDREIDRIAAIIQSMTPAERENPKILNASRRQRIAKGAGVQVSDINQLIERFSQAQKMMKQMRRGGGMPQMPGMPPMPGMGGGGRKKAKAKPAKGKRRSGNPAKRAAEAQQRAAAQEAREQEQIEAALATPLEPSTGEIPDSFKQFLR